MYVMPIQRIQVPYIFLGINWSVVKQVCMGFFYVIALVNVNSNLANYVIRVFRSLKKWQKKK